MSRNQYRSPFAAQGGFTLIEMLLASVIFALVSYASFSMLTAVTDANALSEETTKELYGVQRAFFWMERDFLQATKRQVRVDGEKATDKIFSGGELLMESEGGAVAFTHDGWRNPGMILPRSEIQSVSYRMFEGKLERLFFNYPDPVTGEIPKSQILLEEIEGLSFEFFSSDGWGNVWEKPGLPRAVKVEIETKALGKLERIFLLTDNVQEAGARKGP
jgi:general secretion pathway protein J